MNRKQFDSVVSLDAPKRYQHFISKIADWEEVWSLKNTEGFVGMADDNGNECIPFWPHPDYAEALANIEWNDCKPEKIPLDAFIGKWLPGMEKDGINVAVFPTPESKGIMVNPKQLKTDLEAESKQYE